MLRDAGVHNRNNRTLTLRVLPCVLRIHTVGAVEAPQVLPVLILWVEVCCIQSNIWLDRLNGRISSKLLHEVIGLLALQVFAEVDHVRTGSRLAQLLSVQPVRLTGLLPGLGPRRRLACGTFRLLVGHDEAVIAIGIELLDHVLLSLKLLLSLKRFFMRLLISILFHEALRLSRDVTLGYGRRSLCHRRRDSQSERSDAGADSADQASARCASVLCPMRVLSRWSHHYRLSVFGERCDIAHGDFTVGIIKVLVKPLIHFSYEILSCSLMRSWSMHGVRIDSCPLSVMPVCRSQIKVSA